MDIRSEKEIDVETELVDTGLQLSVQGKDKIWGEFFNIVTGKLTIPIRNDRMLYHPVLDDVVNKMSKIALARSEGSKYKWRAYVAFSGRCWIIEPDGEDYTLSYLDYPTIEDWIITGAVTID